MRRRLLSRGGRGEKLCWSRGDVKPPAATSCWGFAQWGHPPSLQWQCPVGSGRTLTDGSLGSVGLVGLAGVALTVDKLPQGSLKCFG